MIAGRAPELTLCRARTNLFNLSCDRPATLRRILVHGAHLQGQGLLVVRGHPPIQADSQRFLALAITNCASRKSQTI